MKKLMVVLFGFIFITPTVLYTTSPEVEAAIYASDLEKLKKALDSVALPKADREYYLVLAQGVIEYRKNSSHPTGALYRAKVAGFAGSLSIAYGINNLANAAYLSYVVKVGWLKHTLHNKLSVRYNNIIAAGGCFVLAALLAKWGHSELNKHKQEVYSCYRDALKVKQYLSEIVTQS